MPPRSVPACGVEDGPSLLLSASPEWWLGEWGHGRPPTPIWAGWGLSSPDAGWDGGRVTGPSLQDDTRSLCLSPWSPGLGQWKVPVGVSV